MRLADFTPCRLASLMALLRAGLCLMFGFAPLLSKRTLRPAVEQGMRWVETLLFIAAFNRAAPIRKKSAKRPSFAAPGWRLAILAPQAMLRLSRLRRGTVLQRLTRLIAVLSAPERAIARLMKRLARPARLVAIAPSPLVFVSSHVGGFCAVEVDTS